jgi:hypothetical protein
MQDTQTKDQLYDQNLAEVTRQHESVNEYVGNSMLVVRSGRQRGPDPQSLQYGPVCPFGC